MADRRISKRLKGKVMSTCVTPACLYEGRQAKNGGVKGRDGSAEEVDRETGLEQITVGWTRRKDGG